jgi:hypothetical protein
VEPNFVYVMRFSDRIHKIGISIDPSARARQMELLHNRKVSVVRVWERALGDAVAVEQHAHKILAQYRHLDLDGREIFDVTAEVACCAVELALALHRNIAFTIERDLPISTNSRLADLAHLPFNADYLGYLDPFEQLGKLERTLEMRKRGVLPEYIYTDLRAVLKALRPGWTLFVETIDGIDTERLHERGVYVQVI